MFTAVAVASTILGAVSVGVDGNKVIVALSFVSRKTRMKVSSQWQNVLGDQRRRGGAIVSDAIDVSGNLVKLLI